MRILITFLILSFFSPAYANSIKIIRDAEVENFLKEISNILTESTELEKDNLTFFVDNQKYINAFVTPDRKFFFTTELLLKSKSIDDIAGVISHEIGHVMGGHFQKRQLEMQKTTAISVLSSILAVGAIAGGAYEAGSALLMGSQQLSNARLLSFSRNQESLADQTAIRLLKKSGFSLQGLINVFEQLQRNEKIKKINPYFLTHPLSVERIKNIKLNSEKQILREYRELNHKFNLIKAKLNGFFLKKEQLKFYYPNPEKIESIYANALNDYRLGKFKSALILITRCINFYPKNPYFHELKGQMLYESGRFQEAIKSFQISSSILPDEKGFKLFLAKSLYHSSNKTNHSKSIELLWDYVKKDEFPVDAWHYLGLNYGKLKKLDFSSYAFAEKFVLVNKIDNARIHIKKAKEITKNKILIKKINDLEYQISKKQK